MCSKKWFTTKIATELAKILSWEKTDRLISQDILIIPTHVLHCNTNYFLFLISETTYLYYHQPFSAKIYLRLIVAATQHWHDCSMVAPPVVNFSYVSDEAPVDLATLKYFQHHRKLQQLVVTTNSPDLC